MTEKTLKALKASIRVWRKKYKLLSENVGCTITAGKEDLEEGRAVRRHGEVVGRIALGPSACPLCMLYLECRGIMGRLCRGCPVATKTKQWGCSGTPYRDFCDVLPDWEEKARVTKKMVGACKEELDFLVSLLPKSKAKKAMKAMKAMKKEMKTAPVDGILEPGTRVVLTDSDWRHVEGERAVVLKDDGRNGMPLLLKFRKGPPLWFNRSQCAVIVGARKARV